MKKIIFILLSLVSLLLLSNCSNYDSNGNLVDINGNPVIPKPQSPIQVALSNNFTGPTGPTGATGSSNITGNMWVTGKITADQFSTNDTGANQEFLIGSGGAFASPHLWMYELNNTTWVITTRPGGAVASLELNNLLMSGNITFGQATTGSGTALLGANSPATILSAPYVWVRARYGGQDVYFPVWK